MKRGKRRAQSEDPGEPPPPPDEVTGDDIGATGDEPTVRDKIREMEWRHATGVEDLETRPEEDHVVRDGDGGVDEPGKSSGRTAEEVSSSESDEGDVEEMSTEDEEELWRRV